LKKSLDSGYVAAYLEGGPNRKAEVSTAKAVGLKVERISARWDEAEEYLFSHPQHLGLRRQSR
jgi:hypothetical protein